MNEIAKTRPKVGHRLWNHFSHSEWQIILDLRESEKSLEMGSWGHKGVENEAELR